jgi:hypothetical protein
MRQVEHEGQTYDLLPEAVRSSLSDAPPMLWGFPVHVKRGDELICVKTCFVGRVSVHTRDPGAPDAPMERLNPILYDLALERVANRITAGEFDDEIVFA